MKRFDLIGDERGMTLIELLVAITAGTVVIAGIMATVIVTLHETDRLTSHVEANQRARLTMTKVIDQLHSACVAYDFAPVQEGSSGTMLSFLHQTGTAVSPTPVLSKISLSGTTLSQADYASTGGSAPDWTFSSTASSTTQLMTNVSALSTSIPVFRYYAYANGTVSTTPLAVPLNQENAEKAVQVSVAFKVAPLSTPLSATSDPNVATPIQDSALLRFTPSSFETSAEDLPCE